MLSYRLQTSTTVLDGHEYLARSATLDYLDLMLLIIALPLLIAGWFFYQLGRRKRWQEKQNQLTQSRPDMEVLDPVRKKEDKSRPRR